MKIDLYFPAVEQGVIFFVPNLTSPVFKAQDLLVVVLLLEEMGKYPVPAHFLQIFFPSGV
jgi:hypothetical protein